MIRLAIAEQADSAQSGVLLASFASIFFKKGTGDQGVAAPL